MRIRDIACACIAYTQRVRNELKLTTNFSLNFARFQNNTSHPRTSFNDNNCGLQEEVSEVRQQRTMFSLSRSLCAFTNVFNLQFL